MLLIDSLKLNELKKHFENEEDAIKQAIINELNRSYNVQLNDYGTRRFISIKKLSSVDEYYRVEVSYIDYFVTGSVEDTGVYYIHREVL